MNIILDLYNEISVRCVFFLTNQYTGPPMVCVFLKPLMIRVFPKTNLENTNQNMISSNPRARTRVIHHAIVLCAVSPRHHSPPGPSHKYSSWSAYTGPPHNLSALPKLAHSRQTTISALHSSPSARPTPQLSQHSPISRATRKIIQPSQHPPWDRSPRGPSHKRSHDKNYVEWEVGTPPGAIGSRGKSFLLNIEEAEGNPGSEVPY